MVRIKRLTEKLHSSGVRAARELLPAFGLSTKVAILVVIGTISMIGLFAYLGTTALSENTQRNLQERVVLAQMTASYIDALIENIQDGLTHTAGESRWSDPPSANSALDQAYHRLEAFASRAFLVNRIGQVIAATPPVTGTITFHNVTPVNAALNGSAFAVSHVAQPIDLLGPCVVAAAPIRDSAGDVSGALVIILSFTDSKIRAFSNPIGLGESGYMDLVALDGRILASTRPGRIGGESDHRSSLSGMIRDHRPSVSACHDCHTPVVEGEPLAEVLAFAPLGRAQWGIAVRQSEEEVFAPTRVLQSRIFGLVGVILIGALVLVYFTTRSVIIPVQALTTATRRIADGDLDSPIQTQGRDEIGVLARSLDEMRVRLKNSTEEIQAWNRKLDARVQERTAAYEAAAKDNARLYAELQKKEQLRGELLHRVISAQEDERKRIARELHDETSQSLTALLVGLDTVNVASAHAIQKADTHLRSCKSIAQTLLKNIHRLIADLRPTLLDDLGLEPAIVWYGEQRLKPLGIALRMAGDGLQTRLPTSIETALYRIVQEAITNIVRHANATMVDVRFACERDYVTLEISDNGRGFDPQTLQLSEGQGLGLRGMQERASNLGGEFHMQTAPGKGTLITVRVPVSQ
ncbi:MAG: HAMP domain-containing protein [Chloroflexi bacterium]|nr:HAMP domain-containing protein [Chloroflexota bacterium]